MDVTWKIIFDNYFFIPSFFLFFLYTGRRRVLELKHENHRSHTSVNQRTIKLTSCRYFNRLTIFLVLFLSAICDVTGKYWKKLFQQCTLIRINVESWYLLFLLQVYHRFIWCWKMKHMRKYNNNKPKKNIGKNHIVCFLSF